MNLSEVANQIERKDENFDFEGAKVLLVNVTKSCQKGIPLYDASRGVWRLSKQDFQKACCAQYVVAVCNNLIQEVYAPKEWHPAKDDKEIQEVFERFGFLPQKLEGRYAFTGTKAENGWKGKRCLVDFEYPTVFVNF